VYSELEDGLLGLAVDPGYERNRWIYLYYAPPINESKQFLSRFTLDGAPTRNGKTIRVKFSRPINGILSVKQEHISVAQIVATNPSGPGCFSDQRSEIVCYFHRSLVKFCLFTLHSFPSCTRVRHLFLVHSTNRFALDHWPHRLQSYSAPSNMNLTIQPLFRRSPVSPRKSLATLYCRLQNNTNSPGSSKERPRRRRMCLK